MGRITKDRIIKALDHLSPDELEELQQAVANRLPGPHTAAIQVVSQSEYQKRLEYVKQEERARALAVQKRFLVTFKLDDLHGEMNYIATVVAAGMRQNSDDLIKDMLSTHSGILAQHFMDLKEVAAKAGATYLIDDLDLLVTDMIAAVRQAVEVGDCSALKVFCRRNIEGGTLTRFFNIKREQVADRGRPPIYIRLQPLWLAKERENPTATPEEIREAILDDLAKYNEKQRKYVVFDSANQDLVETLTAKSNSRRPAKLRSRVLNAKAT